MLPCNLLTKHGSNAEATAVPMPRSSYIHPACTQRCGRDLLCGHACVEACHDGTTCPTCQQPCKADCNHGKCKGRCTEPCQPCAEPCAWHCPHQVLLSRAEHVHVMDATSQVLRASLEGLLSPLHQPGAPSDPVLQIINNCALVGSRPALLGRSTQSSHRNRLHLESPQKTGLTSSGCFVT